MRDALFCMIRRSGGRERLVSGGYSCLPDGYLKENPVLFGCFCRTDMGGIGRLRFLMLRKNLFYDSTAHHVFVFIEHRALPRCDRIHFFVEHHPDAVAFRI